MKLEASLLRPIIDITGNADFCTELNLDSKIKIPELDANVPAINIPVNINLQTNILGIWVNSFKIIGNVGPIGPETISISTPPNKDIDLTLNGCMAGIARINPLKPIAPKTCCEAYQVPVSCQCEVHKDHNFCGPNCKCK